MIEPLFKEIIQSIDAEIDKWTQVRALLAHSDPTIQPRLKWIQNTTAQGIVTGGGLPPRALTAVKQKKEIRFSPEGQAAILRGQAKRWKKFRAAKRAAAKQQKSLNASMA